MESSSSESVYDADEEEEHSRPLWRRGYFRRLVLPFAASLAMFLAATLVYHLTPRLASRPPAAFPPLISFVSSAVMDNSLRLSIWAFLTDCVTL